MKQNKVQSKDSSRERRTKGAAAERGMTAKRGSVKVVEVKLKGRSKPGKKPATLKSGASRVARAAKSAEKTAAKTVSAKPASARTAVSKSAATRPASKGEQTNSAIPANQRTAAKGTKSSTAKGAPVRTKTLKPALDIKSEPEMPMIEVPTEKLLRPFRKMAEQNRQQAKASKRAEKVARGSFLAKPAKKVRRYYADLRVHTPGTLGYFANGGIDPGPALVRLASVKGLHMIGLADYYNAAYIDQVRSSAVSTGLAVLPGVIVCCEVSGCREVFLLVLFPESAGSAEILALLDTLEVPKSAYGRRDYCLTKDIDTVLAAIEQHGAIAIPSRVDKTPYRQLAIADLVEKYGLHAFDLAHPDSPELFRERWPGGGPSGGFTFFSFSSANALGQIGNRVGRIAMQQPNFEGLREIVCRKPPYATAVAVSAAAAASVIDESGLELRTKAEEPSELPAAAS